MKQHCEAFSRRYGFECGQPAWFFVTYFTDGSVGKSCCGKHVTKAIEEVLSAPTVGGTTVKVTDLKGRQR